MTLPAATGVPPLVGITGRRASAAILAAPWGFADAPIELYFAEYALTVQRSGGTPVHLPLCGDPAALVARLDAVVLAGGEDVDPRRSGRVPGPTTTAVDPVRDEFEIGLVHAALAADVPLLGICRGQQVLNVALGGTLVQHLEIGVGESHGSYAYPRAHRVHDVVLEADSTHAAACGTRVRVNSFHHQAVDRPGDGVRVVGRAPDGVVEAVEVVGHRALGVQWHPEAFLDDPLFGWLVRAASATTRTPAQEAAA